MTPSVVDALGYLINPPPGSALLSAGSDQYKSSQVGGGLSNVIDIKAGGAAFDGTTDDTTVWRNVAAQVKAGGGGAWVHLPPSGTSIISGTVDWTRTFGCTLSARAHGGYEAPNCTVQYTGSSGSMFDFLSSDGIVLDGFTCTCNNPAYTGDNTDLVCFDNAVSGAVGDCTYNRLERMVFRALNGAHPSALVRMNHTILSSIIGTHFYAYNVGNPNSLVLGNNAAVPRTNQTNQYVNVVHVQDSTFSFGVGISIPSPDVEGVVIGPNNGFEDATITNPTPGSTIGTVSIINNWWGDMAHAAPLVDGIRAVIYAAGNHMVGSGGTTTHFNDFIALASVSNNFQNVGIPYSPNVNANYIVHFANTYNTGTDVFSGQTANGRYQWPVWGMGNSFGGSTPATGKAFDALDSRMGIRRVNGAAAMGATPAGNDSNELLVLALGNTAPAAVRRAFLINDGANTWLQAMSDAAGRKLQLLAGTTPTPVVSVVDNKLGFYNATEVVKPATTGTAVGFTAGAGTTVTDQSTFTGGSGATAYRISDIVLALKQLGLLTA